MPNVPARATTHGDLPAIHSSGWLATREQRRAAKEITRMRLRGAVVAAREVTRIDAVEEVSESALLAACHISALEGALAQQTPRAEARLKHIADTSSVTLGSIVARAGRGI